MAGPLPRTEIIERIRKLEAAGQFDRDVEDDPPTVPIKRGEVDYLGKKLSSRISTCVANRVARHHFDGCIKRGELVIDGVEGIDNYLAASGGGLIITCNHFNPFDNYVVFKALQPYLKNQILYKIIREGNYTNFPGLYGFFFRHCNTVPIPSRLPALKEMLEATDVLLRRGEKILIFPEQGMWWNYRKPRPLKSGAFMFAVRAGVPVLPTFITMRDTDVRDSEGFPVQAHTLHILPALRPGGSMSNREAEHDLRDRNYACWKEVYERVYGIPLTYSDGPAPAAE